MTHYSCEDGDYFLVDRGRLGHKTGIMQYGKLLAEFVEYEDVEKFLTEHMAEANFWPNIWHIDDHGGVHPYEMEGETNDSGV